MLRLTRHAGVDLVTVDATGDPITAADALAAGDTASLIGLVGLAITVIVLAVAGVIGSVSVTGFAAVDNAPILA